MVSFLVRDYDEALYYFVKKLGFECLEDTRLSEHKRWLIVSPKDTSGASLLLAKAKNPEETAAIGRQAGGRVFLFLHTENFWATYQAFQQRGVIFRETPRTEDYGKVAVFSDLYGNPWDLIETKKVTKPDQ